MATSTISTRYRHHPHRQSKDHCVGHLTMASITEQPALQYRSSMPPPQLQPCNESIKLPQGWVSEIDPKSGRRFYVNTTTQKSQWKAPPMPTVAPKHRSSPPIPPKVPVQPCTQGPPVPYPQGTQSCLQSDKQPKQRTVSTRPELSYPLCPVLDIPTYDPHIPARDHRDSECAQNRVPLRGHVDALRQMEGQGNHASLSTGNSFPERASQFKEARPAVLPLPASLTIGIPAAGLPEATRRPHSYQPVQALKFKKQSRESLPAMPSRIGSMEPSGKLPVYNRPVYARPTFGQPSQDNQHKAAAMSYTAYRRVDISRKPVPQAIVPKQPTPPPKPVQPEAAIPTEIIIASPSSSGIIHKHPHEETNTKLVPTPGEISAVYDLYSQLLHTPAIPTPPTEEKAVQKTDASPVPKASAFPVPILQHPPPKLKKGALVPIKTPPLMQPSASDPESPSSPSSIYTPSTPVAPPPLLLNTTKKESALPSRTGTQRRRLIKRTGLLGANLIKSATRKQGGLQRIGTIGYRDEFDEVLEDNDDESVYDEEEWDDDFEVVRNGGPEAAESYQELVGEIEEWLRII